MKKELSKIWKKANEMSVREGMCSGHLYLENIIFMFDEFYERDYKMFLDIYISVLQNEKIIPTTYTLTTEVMKYNEAVVFSGVENYITITNNIDNMDDLSLREQDFWNREILEKANQISANVLTTSMHYIAAKIRDVLDTEKHCYIENEMSHPLIGEGYIDSYEFFLMKNRDQRLLIPSLHLQNFDFAEGVVDVGELLDTFVERRLF